MKRLWLAIVAALAQGILGAFSLWYAWFLAGFAEGLGHWALFIRVTGALYGALCLLAGVMILMEKAWGRGLAIFLNIVLIYDGLSVLSHVLFVEKQMTLWDVVP